MNYCSKIPKFAFCQVPVTVQIARPVFVSSLEMKLAELGGNKFCVV